MNDTKQYSQDQKDFEQKEFSSLNSKIDLIIFNSTTAVSGKLTYGNQTHLTDKGNILFFYILTKDDISLSIN